jgi:hypothetical protein
MGLLDILEDERNPVRGLIAPQQAGGLLGDIGGRLSNAYGAGGDGDGLVSLGLGIASKRNLAEGLQSGMDAMQRQKLLKAFSDRQAAMDKLAMTREQRNATYQDRQMKHMDTTEALNQQRMAADQQQQAQALQLRERSLSQPQLMNVPLPDGTIQQQWVVPGQAAGTPVGAPTAGGGNVQRDVAARAKVLVDQGLDPKDPRNQQYMLTGKFPREDAQPLTASDKQAILGADDAVSAAQTAIDALGQAKKLSPQALGGYGAGARSTLGANLPDWMVPDSIASPQSAVATQDLDNLIGQNALGQLKAIFGGNPTEGERAIMLELQGSSSKPDVVRQKIFDRAIDLAKRRLDFNKQRADEMRGGTYFKAGNEPASPAQAQPQAAPASNLPSWRIVK